MYKVSFNNIIVKSVQACTSCVFRNIKVK